MKNDRPCRCALAIVALALAVTASLVFSIAAYAAAVENRAAIHEWVER